MVKHIKDNSKQWPEFLNDVKVWMNKNVAPHLVASVSIFEDEHPCKGGLNCVIVHQDSATEAAADAKDRDIYQFEKVDKTAGDLWQDSFQEMADSITKKQDGRDSFVASATVTQNDSKLLVRISFDRMIADKIKSEMRPDGCCTLF